MAKIWIVTKDPGGHNAVWPAREELKRRRHRILDIAHGKAIELLAAKKISYVVAPDDSDTNILDNWVIMPDVYIL